MKEISEEDKATLARLNKAVDFAIAARSEWLGAKVKEYATLKEGDEVYRLSNGEYMGVIVGHYRYYEGGNPEYDTSISIEYKFRTPSGVIDNTSRQYITLVTKKQLAKARAAEAEMLAAEVKEDSVDGP